MSYTYIRAGQKVTASDLNLLGLVGQHVFYARRATNQSIPSGTEAVANALQWDDIEFDDLGGWSSAHSTRYTCQRQGIYVVSGMISYLTSTAGTTRDGLWFVNGSGVNSGRGALRSGSLPSAPLSNDLPTLPITLSVGDYIELVPGQNSGAALNTATGTFAPFIQVTFARPT